LRDNRTVSSRTPNASAIHGPVQPASVSSTASARSASPRSHDPRKGTQATRCSSLAVPETAQVLVPPQDEQISEMEPPSMLRNRIRSTELNWPATGQTECHEVSSQDSCATSALKSLKVLSLSDCLARDRLSHANDCSLQNDNYRRGRHIVIAALRPYVQSPKWRCARIFLRA
jgi:hypothetical protein